MRTLIRLAIAFIHFVFWTLIGLAITFLLFSCSRVQYYPVENSHRDSIYIKQWERDSVYIRDSVYVHTKADTVFLNRVQYKYREIILRDTMYVQKSDTITVVQEVERNFTTWQSFTMGVGRVMLIAGVLFLIYRLYILYRKLKK